MFTRRTLNRILGALVPASLVAGASAGSAQSSKLLRPLDSASLHTNPGQIDRTYAGIISFHGIAVGQLGLRLRDAIRLPIEKATVGIDSLGPFMDVSISARDLANRVNDLLSTFVLDNAPFSIGSLLDYSVGCRSSIIMLSTGRVYVTPRMDVLIPWHDDAHYNWHKLGDGYPTTLRCRELVCLSDAPVAIKARNYTRLWKKGETMFLTAIDGHIMRMDGSALSYEGVWIDDFYVPPLEVQQAIRSSPEARS